MSITNTLLRRPLAKVAVATAAAGALAGGLYGAQAANAGSSEKTETQSVVFRATTPNGDDNGGQIVAREKPGTDARPAPAPAVERAAEPKRDDHGGQIVARDTPGINERPAPAPAE